MIIAQRSFAAGEVAPPLYARCDVNRYVTSLRTMRNMMTMRQGGAQNRPGTAFVCEAKSTLPIRLIPFRFSDSQTYVLEFGDTYVRFIQNGAQLTDATVNITGITQAIGAVVTSAAHGLSNGQEVSISGVLGMIQVNGANYKIGNVTTNTFVLFQMDGTTPANSTSWGPYTSGGTASRIYEIASPYAVADLPLLDYAQSGDVVTFAHPTYPVQQLSRAGQTSWSFSAPTFAPQIAAPTGVTLSGQGGAGSVVYYVVTAVDPDTGEESVASAQVGWNRDGSSASPLSVAWTQATSPSGETVTKYNVYKSYYGAFGFVGVGGILAGIWQYLDPPPGVSVGGSTGTLPDYAKQPPTSRNPLVGFGNYPSAVGYIQQRLTFGGSNNNPSRVWTSQTGNYLNFSVSTPLRASDAITFDLASRDVQQVRYFVELGNTIIFTSSGEWALWGDGSTAAILSPSQIGAKQYGYNGAARLKPIVVNSDALYVQARGSRVRDLSYRYQYSGYVGYVGDDLTQWSTHLVDGHTIVDWTYQRIPNSIVWMAREDGVLLGLTYVKEEQIVGWHRHDTQGAFENVCSVPEGTEDAVYVVVLRTINGNGKRYVERFDSRLILSSTFPQQTTQPVYDLRNRVFSDSSLTFNGNPSGLVPTMSLSGGVNWTYQETLTLTASSGTFDSTMVGNEIQLTGIDNTLSAVPGSFIRFVITGYTSSTVVTGHADRTVPQSLQGTHTPYWARAVSKVGGLWHLVGQKVAAVGDGVVISSPNNPAYPAVTVQSDGTATFDRPYAVIHVGLPYVSDLETLDIDTEKSETLSDKKMLIGEVICTVWNTQGFFAGPQFPGEVMPDAEDDGAAAPATLLDGMYETKIRKNEGYDSPVALQTGKERVELGARWSQGGRVAIRVVDPIPVTILSIAPRGYVPLKGNG